MDTRFRFGLLFLAALLPGGLEGQVEFSRRVYAEHGRSYQEIWRWDAATGGLKPLTKSPRDHHGLSAEMYRVQDPESAQPAWEVKDRFVVS